MKFDEWHKVYGGDAYTEYELADLKAAWSASREQAINECVEAAYDCDKSVHPSDLANKLKDLK